ncbi:MAG: ABC transporter ATP-binding protein [Treponemataceae bacterium]
MLEVNNVSKHLGRAEGFDLRNISFKLKDGEKLLMLGKNGSGKSTCLKLICNVIVPDSGCVLYNGKDICKAPRKFFRSLGLFQGGKSTLDATLSMRHNFQFTSYMYGMKKKTANEQIEKFCEGFKTLPKLLDKYYNEMSLGEKTICELINSCLHKPEYVFLDEPTTGIDIENKNIIARFIQTLEKEHLTNCIITTHDLAFAQMLHFEKTCVLDSGMLCYFDTDSEKGISLLKDLSENEISEGE